MEDNPELEPAPLWFRLLLAGGVSVTMAGLTMSAASD